MNSSFKHNFNSSLFHLVVAMLFIFGASTVSMAQSATAQQPAAMLQLPPGAESKTATIYGQKIHYIEAGKGPTVILLHGLGADWSSWSSTIGPLAQKYHVIAPDQIGFGRSDKPFINYRVGTLVDFLGGLYKELKIERASLVGNSLGGFTATAFALAYPDKVDRLVLVDAAGYAVPKDVDPRTFNMLNPSTREGMKQVMATIFYNKQMFTSDVFIEAAFTRKMSAGDGYTIQRFIESIIRGEDVLDGRLGAIKQPTLILWGREDLLTPLAMGERFKQDIAGSELVVFEKCGHVPQMEKAAEFNAALMKFLAGSNMASK
jgi:triacylglycerol lipase